MQGQNGEPELIVALQHQHDPVAPPDAQGFKIVGTLGGGILDILKGEPALGHIVGDVQHGQLIRIPAGNGVHGVEGEVIGILIVEAQLLQSAPVVLPGLDEMLAQQGRHLFGLPAGGDEHGVVHLVGGHDHGKELAVPAAHGDHAVGGGAFIEDAVALVQNLLMLAHPDPHGALDHQVEFLTGVGGGVDGLILQLGRILIGNPVRGGQLLMEHTGQILNGDAVLAGGDKALALPGHGVARQPGAGAAEQIRQLNAENSGALVHEGKGKVRIAGLVFPVQVLGNACSLRHLPGTQIHDIAHLANSLHHLHEF